MEVSWKICLAFSILLLSYNLKFILMTNTFSLKCYSIAHSFKSVSAMLKYFMFYFNSEFYESLLCTVSIVYIQYFTT